MARIKLSFMFLLLFAAVTGFFTYLTFEAKESAYVRVYRVVAEGGQPEQVAAFEDTWEEYDQRFRRRVLWFDLFLMLGFVWLSWFLSGKTFIPLERHMRDLEAFAGDVSHSLRTPLTTMRLKVEVMQQRLEGNRLSTDLRALNSEIGYMHRIVEGFLALVRVQQGQWEAPKTKLDLGLVVIEELQLTQPFIQAKELQLKKHVAKRVMIMASETHIRQVVQILLDNAAKYTRRRGMITVRLRQDRSQAYLEVGNQSRGFAGQPKAKLFNRYFRGEGVTESGTGLGLTIAKKFVELQGGVIQVVEKKDFGLVFTVIFPAIS